MVSRRPRGLDRFIAFGQRKPRTRTSRQVAPTGRPEVDAMNSRLNSRGGSPGGPGTIQDMERHPGVDFSRRMASSGVAADAIGQITGDVHSRLGEQGIYNDNGTWKIDLAKNNAYREGRRNTVSAAVENPAGGDPVYGRNIGNVGRTATTPAVRPTPGGPGATSVPSPGLGGGFPTTVSQPRPTAQPPARTENTVWGPPPSSAGNPNYGRNIPTASQPSIPGGAADPSFRNPLAPYPPPPTPPSPGPVTVAAPDPNWTGSPGWGVPNASNQTGGSSAERNTAYDADGSWTRTQGLTTPQGGGVWNQAAQNVPEGAYGYKSQIVSPGLGGYPPVVNNPDAQAAKVTEYTLPASTPSPYQGYASKEAIGLSNVNNPIHQQTGRAAPPAAPQPGLGGVPSQNQVGGNSAQRYPTSQPGHQQTGRAMQPAPQPGLGGVPTRIGEGPETPGQGVPGGPGATSVPSPGLGGGFPASVPPRQQPQAPRGPSLPPGFGSPGPTQIPGFGFAPGIAGLAGLGDRIEQTVQGRIQGANMPGQQPGITPAAPPGLARSTNSIRDSVMATLNQRLGNRGQITTPGTTPGTPTAPSQGPGTGIGGPPTGVPGQPPPIAPSNPGQPTPSQPGRLGSYGNPTIDQWDSAFIAAGEAYGVDPTLLKAMAEIESGGNGNIGLNECRDDGYGDGGSCGLMQIKPGIWGSVGSTEEQIMQAAKILDDAVESGQYATHRDALFGIYFPMDDPNGTTQGSYGAKVDQLMAQMGPYTPGGAAPVETGGPVTSTIGGGGNVPVDQGFDPHIAGSSNAEPRAVWDINSLSWADTLIPGGAQAGLNNNYGFKEQGGAYYCGYADWNCNSHTGVDIPTNGSQQFNSLVTGEVVCVGGAGNTGDPNNGCGAYGDVGGGIGNLTVRTPKGAVVTYGHTRSSYYQLGQQVQVGQPIGMSGDMSGYHVHAEVRLPVGPGGQYVMVDPNLYFGGYYCNVGYCPE